jgi:hypothetical protein
MGLSLRIFFVDEDDSLKRLPLARYKRLLSREPKESLPQYAGQRVRCALVVVDLVDRKPVRIEHVQYSIISFDSEGRIDPSEKGEEARLAMEIRPPLVDVIGSRQVIYARHRFAKKRYDRKYKWKASREIKEAIVAEVFGIEP